MRSLPVAGQPGGRGVDTVRHVAGCPRCRCRKAPHRRGFHRGIRRSFATMD
jgi:hypothetical protein